MRPSNAKNILRVLFISEHDSYVLISIFGLANCLFPCGNKTKVQIHHEVVNKDICQSNYYTESTNVWAKLARCFSSFLLTFSSMKKLVRI